MVHFQKPGFFIKAKIILKTCSVQTSAPIGAKNNQCHFETFWPGILGKPRLWDYLWDFETKKLTCAMALWHWLVWRPWMYLIYTVNHNKPPEYNCKTILVNLICFSWTQTQSGKTIHKTTFFKTYIHTTSTIRIVFVILVMPLSLLHTNV